MNALISIYSIFDEQIFMSAMRVFVVFLIFAFAQILYWMYETNGVITRHFIQCSVGILMIFKPLLISQHHILLVLCILAALFLFKFRKKWWLKVLFDVDYVTYGSYYWSLTLYLLFLVWVYHSQTFMYFRLPIALMTLADGAACLVGRYLEYRPYEIRGCKRTASGSIAFFVISVILCLVLLPESHFFSNSLLLVFTSLLIASIATIVEAVSRNGSDNITVPLSVVMVMWMVESTFA